MLKRILALALGAGVAVFSSLGAAANAQCVPGSRSFAGDVVISSDTTWCGDTDITGDLLVQTGVTLTLEGVVKVVVHGDATVAVGAAISADGLGGLAASGTGAGNSNGGDSGAGGSYGGRGGVGSGGAVPRTYYGSAVLPDQPGSGGGNGRSTGGRGGGVVWLLVGGTLTNDGDVRANGTNGVTRDYGTGGGGSGGTVRVQADVLAGAGLFRANGGHGGGSTFGYVNGGGGGSGGRVVLRYRSGVSVDPANLQVAGGSRGAGAGVHGGAGTAALVHLGPGADTTAPATGADDVDITLTGAWRWEDDDAAHFTWTTVTVRAGTTIVSDGHDVTLDAMTLTGDGFTWDTTRESVGGCDGACESQGSVIVNAVDVALSGSALTAGTGSDWTFSVSTAMTQTGGSTTARAVQLTGPSFTFDGGALVDAQRLEADAVDLTVDATSALSTTARGNGATAGTGAGTSNGGDSGAGGSYGGRGGNGSGGAVPRTYYGSALFPDQLGSGGGHGRSVGGAGGGLIWLRLAGTLTNDGDLRSNGGNGVTRDYGTGGGGSGGAVRVIADTISGSGTFRANGGSGGGSTYGYVNGGGGGSGGRVVLRYRSALGITPDNVLVNGGSRGASAGVHGGAGTAALIALAPGADTSAPATGDDDVDITLTAGWRWEDDDAAHFGWDDITIRPGTVVVSDGNAVTLSATTLSGGAFTWNTTVESTTGCDGTCESQGDVTVEAGEVALSGATLTTGSARDWTFDVSGAMTQTGGTTYGRDVQLTGPSFAFAGAALVDAQRILGDVVDLEVEAGSALSTTARGHGATAGTGAGTSNGGDSGAGGSYGGRGGNGSGGAVPRTYYGSALFPDQLGSGGGNGRSAGGAGGGLIWLRVAGTLLNDGDLRSNGGNGVTRDYGTGGGGSGGAVRVIADVIAGGGTFRANGGDGGGSTYGYVNGGGGGSGGRIVLRHRSALTIAPDNVQVAGGSRGAAAGLHGGFGTAALIALAPGADTTTAATGADDVDITLTDAWRWEDDDAAHFTWRAITARPGTVVVSDGHDLTLNAATLGGDGFTWNTTLESTAGCDGACESQGHVTLNVGDVAVSGSTLTTGASHDWTFNVASGWTQTGGTTYGRVVHFVGAAFTFAGAALVDAQQLLADAGDLLVGPSAALSTSGRGHGATAGTGAGTSNGSDSGAGGSYGGRGGNGSGGAVPRTYYGSALFPDQLGSGGGNGRSVGGSGGGLVWLKVAGTLQVDGQLAANGSNGVTRDYGTGGGGSGGTIRVIADVITGAGFVRANGGAGGGSTYGYVNGGGGGSGGRVALRYVGAMTLDPDHVEVAGGSRGASGGVHGGYGTAALVALAPGADPTVAATGADDLDLTVTDAWRWEDEDAASFSWNTLTVRPGTVVVGDGHDVTLTATTLAGDAFTWDTTRESTTGCDGTCESQADLDLAVDAAALTGAFTLTTGPSSDLTATVTGAWDQADGTLYGRDVTLAGPAFTFGGAARAYAQRLLVDADDVTVGALASLSVAGRGYVATSGPGHGNNNAGDSGGGGGHGGVGGVGSGGAAGGPVYDPTPPEDPCVHPPVDLGSGGGNGRSAGGSGGGYLHAVVTGTLTVDGSLLADGSNGVARDYGTGGGGSGGSIHLDVGALAGAGFIRNNGGAAGGSTYGYVNRGGGGGGGRTFIAASSAAGWAGRPVHDADTAYVAGGSTSGAGHYGQAGTICFADRLGPPLISPAIPDQELRDADALALDLTPYGQDFEDPSAALVWTVSGGDPGQADIALDPLTHVLSVTPLDEDQPWSVVLTLTVSDSDGGSDSQEVTVTHSVTPYRVSLVATPDRLPADGASSATLTATVTSPIGYSVGGKALAFQLTGGSGLLTTAVAITNASGVATIGYVAGTSAGPTTARASLAFSGETVTGAAVIDLTAADPDLAVFTLDITFHDPETGDEIVPGDVDPVIAGELLEVRANVRNIGGLPSPDGLGVSFEDTVVRFSPPGLGAPTLVGTATLPAIDPGESALVSIRTAFFDEGFHVMTVRADPADDLAELDEDNNRGAQGFWIGEPALGTDLIATQCSLDTVVGLTTPTGTPATHPGGAVQVWGRADYGPFLPFDPTGALGIAAVKGGLVELSLTNAAGNPVTLSVGGTQVMPAVGDHGQLRALHTIGSWPGADKSPVGRYPNRGEYDRWTFPAPAAFGCYTLNVCVDDTSFEGCCQRRFCVVPQGADLTCSRPALPQVGGADAAPVVGDGTQLTTTVGNGGDSTAYDVKARLTVDGAPTGQVVTLAQLAPGESQRVAFDWTPACADGEVAVEVDFNGEIDEQDESNNVCRRDTPDLRLYALPLSGVARCQGGASLAVSNLGEMPVGDWDGALTVTSPSGVETTVTGAYRGAGSFPILDGFTFAEIGVWTFAATADTPIDQGAGQCGAVPEQVEEANNLAATQVELCPNLSPWRDHRGSNYLTVDLAVADDPVVYGTPTTVTARVYNRGNLTVFDPVEVLLRHEHVPADDLATDADATGDVKVLENSCGDGIEPGAFKEVSWVWTPTWRDPEVRQLVVVVDPDDYVAECDETDNATGRGLQLNLSPWKDATAANHYDPPHVDVIDLDVDSAPQFGAAQVVTATVFNRKVDGRILVVPNGEGGQTRFTIERADGSQALAEDTLITSPAPGAPQSVPYTWTPTAAECDPANPVQRVTAVVDRHDAGDEPGVYLETRESDNATYRNLPDLRPTDIRLTTSTCQGDFYFTAVNVAPRPTMGVGSWYAQLTVTFPDGATTVFPRRGPFSGTGEFLIESGVDTSQQGDYQAHVVVDHVEAGLSTTACGELPERDELNNAYDEVLNLCPDPSPWRSASGANGVTADIVALDPVKIGTPVRLEARIHNYGTNSISKPVTIDLNADLGGVAVDPVTDYDLPDSVVVDNSCADPIDPGQHKTVRWTWTPTHETDLRRLVVTVDPANDEPAECRETNNVTTRALYIDLSPWKDYYAANGASEPDIVVDGPPEFGAPLTTDYDVFNYPPVLPAGAIPPLILIPNGGDHAKNDSRLVRLNGTRELLPLPAARTQILSPAPGAPQPETYVWTPSAAQCDVDNPIQSVEVFVDSLAGFLEADTALTREFNNTTTRALPDLVVTGITRTAIVDSRADLDWTEGNAGGMSVGGHEAEGHVTLPDGTVVDLGSLGVFNGTGARDLADAFVFRQNGTYKAYVLTDVPEVDNACGNLPEKNEQNNDREQPFPVCPDPTPDLTFGGALKYEVPVTLHVDVTNIGSNTLVEDVQITLTAKGPDGVTDVPLELDDNPKVLHLAFDTADVLNPGGTRRVDFLWTPRQDHQVGAITATLAVLDTDGENGDPALAECDTTNNTDTEPLRVDLSPWRDAANRGENHLPAPSHDILFAAAPVNGVEVDTTTKIWSFGTIRVNHADVTLRELRGGCVTPADDVASVEAPFMPTTDATLAWTPQTVRSDPDPRGRLYGVQVIVDEDDLVYETPRPAAESNNTTRRILLDLAPADVRWPTNACVRTDSPARGEAFDYVVRVVRTVDPACPVPETDLSPYSLAVLVDGVQVNTVGPLSGTGTFTVLSGYAFDSVGDHTVEVRVDEDPADAALDNRVPERNEDNNRRAEVVTVHEPRPDFTVGALGVAHGDPGDPVTVGFSVGNVGEAVGGDVLVHLYVDGGLVDSAVVPGPLAIGGSTPVQLTWASGTVGDHTALVVVDPLAAVVECAEANSASRAFNIPAPAVCVDAIDFVSLAGGAVVEPADPGAELVVQAFVSNAAGAGTATNVTGEVRVYAGAVDVLVGTFTVPTLAAGQRVPVALVPNYAVPAGFTPAAVRPGHKFAWRLNGPAPAEHVFRIVTTSTQPANTLGVCGPQRGIDVGTVPPPDPVTGCAVALDFPAAWQACGAGAVTLTLTRPDGVTPLGPADVSALSATFTTLEGEALTPPLDVLAHGTYAGGGVWSVSVPLGPEVTTDAVSVSVQATLTNAQVCVAEAPTLVAPGVPDLYVYSDMIHFVSKNGDPTPFNQAEVGDDLVLSFTIGNAAGACAGRDVTGDIFIQLGFDEVDLGSWTVPLILPGEELAVTLEPNPYLPTPPEPLGDGTFAWTVTPPSPWLNVFDIEITGSAVPDASPLDNAATKSLLVGDFGVPGEQGCELAITTPPEGQLWLAEGAHIVRFGLFDRDGEPLAGADLARLTVFFLSPDGTAQVLEPLDVLADPAADLGDGSFRVTVTPPAELVGEEVLVMVLAGLPEDGTCDDGVIVNVVDDVPACACVLGDECLQEGEYALVCFDDGARQRCEGGELVAESCGQDSCVETGGALGGGTCDALDHFCAGGFCDVRGEHLADACSGEAAVTTYACSADNACVPTATSETDSCVDSGDASGGGACAASDWSCEDGVLSVVASGGEDACTGPRSVRVWACDEAGAACVASDHAEADSCLDDGGGDGGGSCVSERWACEDGVLGSVTDSHEDACVDGQTLGYWSCDVETSACVETVRAEADSCTDSGDVYGGGACAAVDWTCDGGVMSRVETGGADTCGGDEGAPSVTTFACSAAGNACEAATHAEVDSCVDSGDGSGGGACAASDWRCVDGTLSALTSGGDDVCTGERSVRTWACDGASCVASDHGEADSCVDTGDVDGGGSCVAERWACQDGVLGSVVEAHDDACVDGQTLRSWTCDAATSACVEVVRGEADSCVDSGDATGGGVCGAVDWACVDGVMGRVETSGTDTCGGDDDAPTVTTYACNAAGDACEAGGHGEVDGCVDGGGALGGGSCQAADWACATEGGVGRLAVTASDGDDACLADGDAPRLVVFGCAAADGVVADTCQGEEVERTDVCVDTGDASGGGSCQAADWACDAATGTLVVTESGGDDACSGDADAPTVTAWRCEAGEGGVADTCLADARSEQDSCADRGDALGGGGCQATDWACVDGRLTRVDSDGVDVCIGDADHPGVALSRCEAGDGVAVDRCAPSEVTRDDHCAVTDGRCAAEDWRCVDGALTSVGSGGLEGCVGLDFTSWSCAAASGAVADTCEASQASCDDDDACTVDACDPVAGCVNEAICDCGGCTYTKGYWKNHPAGWPVTTLVIGGVERDQPALIDIMSQPPKGDATYVLASQLVAARLNLATGADDCSVAGPVEAAEVLLVAVPIGTKPGGSERDQLISLAVLIQEWNEGAVGPGHCDESAPPPDDPCADAGTRCVDQDDCTVDSCDASGACVHTAIPGCAGGGDGCVRTQGYWKNHPEDWAGTSLTLGGVDYDQAQLLAIFGTAPKGDATYSLAHQLIAARLNVKADADEGPIADTLVAADAWLVQAPIGSKPGGALRHLGVDLAAMLDSYNNGALGPAHCD